ncbi:MAG: hypothetical protein ABI871_01450 [Chthoniobacterales bacterium]
MTKIRLAGQFSAVKTIVYMVASVLIAAWIAHPALSQTASTHRRSVWVAPPTGSLLGGGYVDAGETNDSLKARLSANEIPVLRAAINSLDAQAGTIVQGWSLIAPAVAHQADVSLKILGAQRAKTGMSYGELLVANSLAKAGGQTFETILGMKGRAGTWGQLASQLKVNPDSIAARARAATESIKFAEARRRDRRQQNLKDSGFNPGGQGGGNAQKFPGLGGG